jgi:hypothetical protein
MLPRYHRCLNPFIYMRDLAVAVLVVWGTDWPHTNSDYGRGKPLTEISPRCCAGKIRYRVAQDAAGSVPHRPPSFGASPSAILGHYTAVEPNADKDLDARCRGLALPLRPTPARLTPPRQ